MKKLILLLVLFCFVSCTDDVSPDFSIYKPEYQIMVYNSLSEFEQHSLVHQPNDFEVWAGYYDNSNGKHLFDTLKLEFIKNEDAELINGQRIIAVEFWVLDSQGEEVRYIIIDTKTDKFVGYTSKRISG